MSTNMWRAGAAYRRGDAVQVQQASRQRQRAQQQVPPLSAAERKEVEEAFDLFDADRTGVIDYHELKVALRALGFPAKKAEVLRIVQRYDVDDAGRVTKKQFVAIMTQKYAERDPEDEIRKAFQLFDADNTGRISLKNMQMVARELGQDIDEDELEQMIAEFDDNRDGFIDEREFIQIMTQSSLY